MIALLLASLPLLGAALAMLRLTPARALGVLVAVALLDAVAAAFIAFDSDAILHLGGGLLVVDATSRLFLLLVNLIFFGIATYIANRARTAPELLPDIGRVVVFALLFIAAANLAISSNHLIGMWVFLEVTTIVAVPLIQHRGGAAALRASWKYFLFSCVGLALVLLGFVCLARSQELGGGDVSFYLDRIEVATGPDYWRRLGLLFVLLGYGTKLGLAPMYAWLPETYAAAPPPVTALLAAVQFNVVAVAVFRVLQVYRGAEPDLIGFELLALGLASMAVSAFGIIATRNYKRLIAYASVNHGGVIAVGLGVGKAATYGVVLYVVSNAFIKAILFLTAGKIRSHYRSEDMGEVAGLLKDLPYSGLFFMIGTFALLGFPPFGSFLGEIVIMSGLIHEGYFVVFVGFGALLLVTFVATGRAVFPMIWGEPKRVVTWGPQRIGALLPKLVFFCVLVVLGIYLPRPVNDLFRQVAAGLGGE